MFPPRLDLVPINRSVGLKAKPTKPVTEVLRPVVAKYGLDLGNLLVRLVSVACCGLWGLLLGDEGRAARLASVLSSLVRGQCPALIEWKRLSFICAMVILERFVICPVVLLQGHHDERDTHTATCGEQRLPPCPTARPASARPQRTIPVPICPCSLQTGKDPPAPLSCE